MKRLVNDLILKIPQYSQNKNKTDSEYTNPVYSESDCFRTVGGAYRLHKDYFN